MSRLNGCGASLGSSGPESELVEVGKRLVCGDHGEVVPRGPWGGGFA